MKNYIIFLLIALSSCNPNNNPTPTPTGFTGHWIPNWWNNDTLIAYELDSMNHFTGYVDTIFTKTVLDTSMIIYRGEKIYVWKEPLFVTDTFKDNQQTYVNCCISPTLNKANAYSYNAFTGVAPYKYLDAQNNWSHQYQSILVNNYAHFRKVNGSTYTAIHQH